jgi:hypothetical protein
MSILYGVQFLDENPLPIELIIEGDNEVSTETRHSYGVGLLMAFIAILAPFGVLIDQTGSINISSILWSFLRVQTGVDFMFFGPVE